MIKKYPKVSLLFVILMVSVFSIYGWSSYQVNNYNSYMNQSQYVSTINGNLNLVFYKKGCVYCGTGKSAVLKESNKSQYPTYFIDVDTTDGQKLVKKYQIEFSYTLVRIRGNNVEKSLYVKDEGENIVVDTKVIESMDK